MSNTLIATNILLFVIVCILVIMIMSKNVETTDVLIKIGPNKWAYGTEAMLSKCHDVDDETSDVIYKTDYGYWKSKKYF
jgi:CDP-diacylglycerol pyrophosphatase